MENVWHEIKYSMYEWGSTDDTIKNNIKMFECSCGDIFYIEIRQIKNNELNNHEEYKFIRFTITSGENKVTNILGSPFIKYKENVKKLENIKTFKQVLYGFNRIVEIILKDE